MTYPPDWPRCACGDHALDGHLTCGRLACDERAARELRDGGLPPRVAADIVHKFATGDWRLAQPARENTMDEWVIWSYEHEAWWGPDHCGYTLNLAAAGRYSRDEARAIVARANIVKTNEVALRVPQPAPQLPTHCAACGVYLQGGATEHAPECPIATVWTRDTEDGATVMQLTAEMLRITRAMELVLRPDSVFHLVALLQLAKRHPDVSEHSRALADTFIAGACEYFADSPMVLDVIRRGDDPAEDRQRES